MRFIRYAAIAVVAYVGIVVAFEAYLGIAQPRFHRDPAEKWDATIVIATTGSDGSTQQRVVTPMVSDGNLYVSANHWPRSWYNRVLENPKVKVTNRDETKDYLAVPIPAASEEHDRLQREHPHSAGFRFVTGYPPRRFVRFEER
ncbi:MAG: nitroreductase/quinone reductase family protein [Candidatus Binatia bacterium]